MEIIKRKILLEDSISRNQDTTYGLMTASTFYVNISLTQNIDNIGIYTNIDYTNETPDYTILVDKLNSNGFTFPFMTGGVPPSIVLSGFTGCTRIDGANVSEWYSSGDILTGVTESRVNELKSYNKTNRFIVGFDIESETYTNYDNQTINGVSRILPQGVGGFNKYTFDGSDDGNLGTSSQETGLLYEDSKTSTEVGVGVAKGFLRENKQLSTVQFKAEGWNLSNSSLSALTKEEYLFGIINEPEVFSDVFIDRGLTTVMEKHLKLSEVESLEHLEIFGNGFYNIVKI